MTTVSLKLPDPLALQLTETARRKSMSKSALIRDALEAYLLNDKSVRNGSALALAADFQGMFAGPEDLSINREHLRNFGR
ncbi:MAG: ribbon-helix-helix domain-containing protein [Gammaproteobacteria bacterium]|nr:ribbon-helix-helix domain-containing protein [Gammaproteobacteria bacterium]